MVGCTRQASFDAATFREAFKKNSCCNSAVAMRVDRSNILHHSFVNALDIDATRVVGSGSTARPLLYNASSFSEIGECSRTFEQSGWTDESCIEHNAPEPLSAEDSVSLKERDNLGIQMPLRNTGKKICESGDGQGGPDAKSLDRNVYGQELENIVIRKSALRSSESQSSLSVRPPQLRAGISYSQDAQERVAGRDSPVTMAGRKVRCRTHGRVFHCEQHARDFSDCMSLHFVRPLPFCPREIMMNIVKEALEERRSRALPPKSSRALADSLPGCGAGLEMRCSGDAGCKPEDSNVVGLDKEGMESLERRITEEDGEGIGEKAEVKQIDGRKRELPGQNAAKGRLVRQRSPVGSSRSVVHENQDLLLDESYTDSFVQDLFASVKIKNLIGYTGKNARVGGCAVKPENLRRPMDDGDEGKLSDSAHSKKLSDDSINTEMTLKIKYSGKENDFDSSVNVCGKNFRNHYWQGCAGKCSKVHTMEIGGNPLEILGPDIMLQVFSLLDARSLARCGVLCNDWKQLAHMDSLWFSQCVKLWEGKFHRPCSALQDRLPKVAAYSRCVQDAKRTWITGEDLCDHIWEFRFKSVFSSP